MGQKNNAFIPLKIAVLTVGKPEVEGDTLSADSIVAENITGTSKGDNLTVTWP